MNKKVVLSWLSLVTLVVTSALVPVAPANTLTSMSGSAFSSGVLAPNQNFGAGHGDNGDDGDDGDNGDNGDGKTPGPKQPLVFPPPKTPLIPTQRKPTILDQSTWSPPEPLQPILGYTFASGMSNWTIPVRAAAFVDITPDPSQRFTPVGMVEIGANPETETESQIYLVNIDLASRATRVRGQLVPVTPPDISPGISSAAAVDTLDVIFLRIPQRLNPERTNSPYEAFQGLPSPQNSMATISADGVCFVVKTGNGTSNGGDDDSDNGNNDDVNSSINNSPIYNAYCSQPSGPDGSDAPLSVMDNFSSQYAELQGMISDVAAPFGLENRIQMDEIISTLESIQGIQDCASTLTEEACGSDIIAALVTEQYFAQQFREKFGGNGDGGDEENRNNENGENNESQTVSKDTASIAADNNNGENDDHSKNNDNGNNDDRDKDHNKPSPPLTPIEVAVVKVLKPIETPNTIVQPGDYRMDFWFDSNGLFFAATLTGMTTDNIQVTNQQIPGVPATFIDQRREGPHQPALQISAKKCNIFGRSWCVWWENC